MRIIQRHLLLELVRNFSATLVVLAALMSMVFFSVAATQSSRANLAFEALVRIVGLQCANRLDVLLPLATLVSVIWTYARARADGEVTAMRGAGIGLMAVIMPAAALGAATTAALAWLSDEVIPESHYRTLIIGRRQLAADISNLLLDESKDIRDKRFKVCWGKTTKDAEGYVVLEDIVVAENLGGAAAPRITRGREARPTHNPSTGELTLRIRDFTRDNKIASDEIVIVLDLNAVTAAGPPNKRIEDLTYEEILTAGVRGPEKETRKMKAEFHRRAASSFSPFLFALLGAPFGLILRIPNRALVFAIAFLLVLLLHYGPILIGFVAAKRGTLPVIPAIWLGNALVLVAAGFLLRRAAKG